MADDDTRSDTLGRRRRATAIGFAAVLMWASLALLTTQTGDVPPFQLTAMAFALAFALALAKWLAAGERPARHLAWPARVWGLGIGGLFGYHVFYFVALDNAPAVEASLIAFLWPLLIVLMSAALPGERLRWWHLAGAAAGLAGAALLVTGGGRLDFRAEFALGYAAAAGCALTWSTYSVLSRRIAHVPTDAVGGFCGATALLALVCHLAFETTVWPAGGEWLAVAGLGLGPVGAAFFAWDHGVKHGDIRALGVGAYLAPAISTLLLVAFGLAPATPTVAGACALIVGAAALASRDLLGRGPARSPTR